MSAVVTIAIAALSAGIAVASLIAYLYVAKRSDLVTAREEALALARTRREVIAELRERLSALERAKADSDRRVREVQAALDRTRAQARQEAYQTQHLYAVALSELANGLRSDLKSSPPDVAGALVRIRKLLASGQVARRRSSRRG